MELKTNWVKTTIASVIGILYIFVKLFPIIDWLVFLIIEVINCMFCTRPSDIGVISRTNKNIYQSPSLKSIKKYMKVDYHEERNKVRKMVSEDFKMLILEALEKYQVVYIETNNFIYKNVLIELQDANLIKFNRLKGHKAPQILEKLRIMNKSAVTKCFFDFEALKKLFQMEEVYKYRLERVDV